MSNEELVPLDLETLREVAEAATDGPWEAKQGAVSPGKKVVGPRESNDLGRGPIVLMQPIFWDKRSAANADHIAAFDPPTAIALLDRIARLTESNRKLANQIVGYGDRVQESVRSIQADAWDEGKKTSIDYLFGPEAPEPNNPYRSTSETI